MLGQCPVLCEASDERADEYVNIVYELAAFADEPGMTYESDIILKLAPFGFKPAVEDINSKCLNRQRTMKLTSAGALAMDREAVDKELMEKE